MLVSTIGDNTPLKRNRCLFFNGSYKVIKGLVIKYVTSQSQDLLDYVKHSQQLISIFITLTFIRGNYRCDSMYFKTSEIHIVTIT